MLIYWKYYHDNTMITFQTGFSLVLNSYALCYADGVINYDFPEKLVSV